MYSTSMIRTPSTSSSEDICWERKRKKKRERGGKEPDQTAEKPMDDSDAAQGGNETDDAEDNDATTQRQPVNKYYNIKKMLRMESISKESVKKKVKDKPAIFPEGYSKKPPEEEFEDDNRYNDNRMFYIIMGYITGIILALCLYLVYYELVGQDLNVKWFLIVISVLLILVLCYSHMTRCVGVLLVPILCGYRGRLLFIGLAFYLAVSGPVMNIIQNIEIMIHTLACGQGLLKHALTPMHQIMGEPVYIVEQSVYNCLSQVRQLIVHLDDVLLRLESPIVGLYSTYRNCGKWLRHQQNFFDNQMGTPYDRCMGAGSISMQECKSKFPDEKSACNIEKRFDWFCSNLKDLPSFFDPQLQQHQEMAEQLFTRPLEVFDKIRSHFEASITFDHVQKLAEDEGRPIHDIDLEIGNQFDLDMKTFMFTFIWLDVVIFVLIIIIFLAALHFRMHYLGSENYRNVYLTNEFYEYNSQQITNLGYSALPLRSTEKCKYSELFAFRHLPIEVDNIHNSLLFMIITSLQLFVICFVDLSMFWMLAIMSYHSHQTAELQPPQYTRILVEGGGMIGYILRGLVKAFEPASKNIFVDIQRCLPLPAPPMYMRCWEIMMICMLAWMLLFLEPYCLRARHLIMSKFYPDNAKRRAKCLHQRLLRDREIFILAARRKARAMNAYVYDNWLYQSINSIRAWLHWLTCGHYGAYKNQTCIICYAQLTKEDYIECETPKCRGVYCQTCYIESNCHCILCNPPSVYGDYTNYSEVEDSSDDPEGKPFRPHNIYCGPTPSAKSERDKSL